MTETTERAPEAAAPLGDVGPARHRPGWARALAAALTVAAVLFAVSTWAYNELPPAMRPHPTPQALAPSGYRWLQAWSWWDGAWYVGIAEHGYRFTFGRRHQSATAFFPAYPLAIRALTPVTGNPVLAGFLVTLVSGLAAAVLFYAWSVPRIGPEGAGVALAALLLYPCSFYLFGTLYADALFLVLALAAFLLLERDRALPAGVVAALATAARPTGLALVAGLWVRTLERRGAFGGRRSWRTVISSLKPSDAGVLLAPAGLLAYAGYLWSEFGRPLMFLEAERGWGQAPGLRTWLKLVWFDQLRRRPFMSPPHYHLVGNLLAAVVALALAVLVFRRLGWGYGAYSVTLLVGAVLSTKNFVGMGRYALGAFPCFAVAGTLLARRPVLRWAVLAVSASLLLLLTELHARNMLIS